MSTHVYLLRHAETATPDVFHGFESDVGLSVRGEQQAEVVAAELAGLRIDGLVSSGMLRARLTAATGDPRDPGHVNLPGRINWLTIRAAA